MKNVCFGVKILTFNNPNKLKPMKEYVEEAIDCVRRQTYPHWKILLIGDHYEPHSEFVQLSRLAPKDKIVAVNLPRSPEREIHTGYKYLFWQAQRNRRSELGKQKPIRYKIVVPKTIALPSEIVASFGVVGIVKE
jgi:hypothetical protein